LFLRTAQFFHLGIALCFQIVAHEGGLRQLLNPLAPKMLVRCQCPHLFAHYL
jgi:hypothetical protein